MKGIAHFSIGVAAATFIPGVMERALAGNGYDILIAGAFGLLPDTLDFKFARFFEREDYVIDPDPDNLDPQAMADTLAKAVDEADKTGKEVRVRFHTVALAPDRWRKYEIGFNTDRSEVSIKIGEIVNTSQEPLPGSEPPSDKALGTAKTSCRIIQNNDKPSRVDILSGPTLGLKPRKKGKVEVIFIPWHRQWSHSFTMGIYLGLAAWLLFGWYYALLVAIPFMAHVAADCLGFMGGNLFWPFTKERISGLKFFHASAPLANFFGVWISGLIIVYNANRVAFQKAFEMGLIQFFLIWLGIPALIVVVYSYIIKRAKPLSAEQEQAREFLDEVADGTDFGSAKIT